MTTKIAVVLLYLRMSNINRSGNHSFPYTVFTGVWSADRITPAFRATSWIIIVVLILSIIAFDLGLIFQASFISAY